MADRPVLTRRWSRLKIGCTIAAVVAGAFFLTLCYGFGSPVHWSDDIHGTVIDEESGMPVAGAAVCAKWLLAGFSGSEALALYKTAAVTDAQGRYVLRGMPVRVRPPLTWFGDDDPQLVVYKPGYIHRFIDNHYLLEREWPRSRYLRSAKRRCDWDGKSIPLERVKSPQQEGSTLESVYVYLLVGAGRMTPHEYPQVWYVLLEGHRRLPPAIRETTPDPQRTIDYFQRGGTIG
jgi:hypothetical protein